MVCPKELEAGLKQRLKKDKQDALENQGVNFTPNDDAGLEKKSFSKPKKREKKSLMFCV